MFPNLTNANVEFLTNAEWDWIVADSGGTVVKSVRHSGGGWTSIDLPSLGIYGEHSLGFRNVSGGEKKIRGGDLTYG